MRPSERGNNNSHLTPQPDDHGIQYEPSDEFLKNLEEEGIVAPRQLTLNGCRDRRVCARAALGCSDVRHALDLINEASRELDAMIKAKPRAKGAHL